MDDAEPLVRLSNSLLYGFLLAVMDKGIDFEGEALECVDCRAPESQLRPRIWNSSICTHFLEALDLGIHPWMDTGKIVSQTVLYIIVQPELGVIVKVSLGLPSQRPRVKNIPRHPRRVHVLQK